MRARILGAAALAFVAISFDAAQAQISDNVVRIGVLTDMSGPASDATGQGSVTAARMAIDDFGGKVLGVPIELIVADSQLKPDIGAGIARKWYDVDGVKMITGLGTSSVTPPLLPFESSGYSRLWHPAAPTSNDTRSPGV